VLHEIDSPLQIYRLIDFASKFLLLKSSQISLDYWSPCFNGSPATIVEILKRGR